jgi:hypothetical protein
VDFQAVLASSLNTVELDFPGFVLRNVAWTAQVAEGELVRGADDEEPYPSVRVTPGGFPPWFA